MTGSECLYLRPLLVLGLALCLALCLLPIAPGSVSAHGRHHLQYIQIIVFTKELIPKERGINRRYKPLTMTYLCHIHVWYT